MLHKLNVKTGIAFFILLSLGITGISRLTMPFKSDFYYQDHYDVVFFGTSESFTTFDANPYYDYGISAYNRGRMVQPLFMTYYYMLDSIDACDINTFVLEPHAIYDDTEPGTELNDEMIDSTLNNMRFSKYKVQLIMKCLEDKIKLQNLFYLDKYHGRWQEMLEWPAENWGYLFRGEGQGENMGFQPWTTTQPGPEYPSWEFRTEPKDFEISETSEEYLEKIYQLCQDNNIRLIVAKSIYPCNEVDVGVAQYMEKWCEERDVPYINYMLLYEQLGIDEETDDADGGWHLNEKGAAKVSEHMLNYIGSLGYYKKMGEE
ncbi:MAG: SGNH/GDSL hydrolase family protein [Pseudobutyrivibrio sp.]|nr:SGNH/GDSL hydrolase family protein [Pseudobutyrivibrio sp.]